MGRIFLLLIIVGFAYGGYSCYSSVAALQDPDAMRERYKAEPADTQKTEGQDSRSEIKARPASTSSEVLEPEAEKEPLPVISSSSDFIQLEGWGILEAGEELPDGSVLRAWSDKDAIVTAPDGTTERRRFRRFHEALRDLLPVATAEPAPAASSWVAGTE